MLVSILLLDLGLGDKYDVYVYYGPSPFFRYEADFSLDREGEKKE